jgi:hypothetical protein
MIKKYSLFTVAVSIMLLSSSLYSDVILDTGGVSAQWYNPTRDGEGIFVEIVDSDGGQKISVAWFTYDDSGNQMWLVGIATLQSLQTTVTIPVVVTSGPIFGPDYDPDAVNRTPWGTLTLNFSSCSAGTLSYASSLDFGSGAINLIRLTSLTQVQCDETPPIINLRPGRWDGDGICFWVAEDGRTITPEGSLCDSGRSVDVDINGLNENDAPCEAEVKSEVVIVIIDGSFAYSRDGESITGTFTSADSAAGLAQEIDSTTCTAAWRAFPAN